jgi:hypothetical protein
MGQVLSIVGIALLAGGAAVALPAADPAPDALAKLTGVDDMVARDISSVKDLLRQSQRQSTALRTSCIEDKLKELELKKHDAERMVKDFGEHKGDPAAVQKLVDESSVVEIFSAALVRDARNCKDATATQVRLEVEFNGKQTPTAPTSGLAPLPDISLERPPLATPF